jgi:hypothetical protein
MFAESLARAPEGSRAKSLTIAVSVAVHAAAGLVLVGMSFWKIDRLPASDRVDIVMQGGLSAPPGEPLAPSTPKANDLKRVKTDETVQPTDRKPLDTPASNAPSGPAGPSGPACDGCDPDGTGTTPFAGPGPEGPGPSFEPPPSIDLSPPVIEPPPANIAQDAIEGQRIAGTAQIRLGDPLRSSLSAQGVSALKVVAQMCLDTQGAPRSITIRTPSGFEAVDETVADGMRAWRYKPYRVAGDAVPACFIVVFNYRITK